jgi:hypothetical protein
MLLDLGKSLTFLAGLLSLFPLLFSALFVPGIPWQDRILFSLGKAAISGSLCLASGLLFFASSQPRSLSLPPVLATLPVRVFFWALIGMVFLFVASWYLETYYVPLLWKNLPYKF